MLAIAVLTLALVPSCYPHRAVGYVMGAVVAVVLASLAMTSPGAVALAMAWLAVGVAYSDGNGTAPEAPGYLQHRYRVREPVRAPRRRAVVVFSAPVWDDVAVTVDLSTPWAEADRLLACYSRALASRHQTRAASYWRRYCDLVRSVA
jgi:hypothetical protein